MQGYPTTPTGSGSSLQATPNPSRVLDVRDLRCPLPVLRAVKALRSLPPGAVLEVWATDPASLRDMRALADQGVAEVVAQTQKGDDLRHWLRRPVAPDAG